MDDMALDQLLASSRLNGESKLAISVPGNSFLNFFEEDSTCGSSPTMLVKRFFSLPDNYKVPETEASRPTTLMLRNIPSKFDQDSLLAALSDRGYTACNHFDFLYLPIDLRTQKNLGYAFVNFLTPDLADQFKLDLSNVRLKQESPKLLEVGVAKLQGFKENCDLFSTSAAVATMAAKYQPTVFCLTLGCMVPLSVYLNAPSLITPVPEDAIFEDDSSLFLINRLMTAWSVLGEH